MASTPNPYCQRLGITSVNLAVAARNGAADELDLMILALLSTGRRMTIDEIVDSLFEVAAGREWPWNSKSALLHHLSEVAQDPIELVQGGLSLDTTSPRMKVHLAWLGLRAPERPTAQEVRAHNWQEVSRWIRRESLLAILIPVGNLFRDFDRDDDPRKRRGSGPFHGYDLFWFVSIGLLSGALYPLTLIGFTSFLALSQYGRRRFCRVGYLTLAAMVIAALAQYATWPRVLSVPIAMALPFCGIALASYGAAGDYLPVVLVSLASLLAGLVRAVVLAMRVIRLDRKNPRCDQCGAFTHWVTVWFHGGTKSVSHDWDVYDGIGKHYRECQLCGARGATSIC